MTKHVLLDAPDSGQRWARLRLEWALDAARLRRYMNPVGHETRPTIYQGRHRAEPK